MLRRLAHSSCGALARRPPTASFAPAAAATATAGPRASAAAAAAPLSTSASASPTPTTPPTAAAEPLYKYLTPASMLEGRPPAVARALAIHNADAGEKKQAAKQARIAQFGLRPGDTGSTPVQVACLTVRIEAMRAHCQANKQDKAAKRAFTTLLTRRRNLLQYLRRKDFEAYTRTLAELRITGFS